MDTNVSILSDAILLAERIQYADDFIKTGYHQGGNQQQHQKQGKQPKGAGPMDLDTMSPSQQGKPRGKPFKPRVKQQNTTDKPQAPFQCFYCGKDGHYARDCYKKKNKQQQQGRYNNMTDVMPPPPPPLQGYPDVG